jgi:putative DNA methylase
VNVGRIQPLPESRGHTPIYKLHRYFARRPHNQFRSIIDQCSPDRGIVLDCMAGGGVTLIEGLTLDRRVISVDVNPIAALVQLGQATEFDPYNVERVVQRIVGKIPAEVRTWYDVACPRCPGPARVRWFDCAHYVRCPECQRRVELAGDRRARNPSGRVTPGQYTCRGCKTRFRAVDVPREGHVYLRARVKCLACGHQESRSPAPAEIERAESIAAREVQLSREHALEIPSEEIPLEWDRQHEDALARKGFRTFADLFTPRNRIILAFMLGGLRHEREQLDEEDFVGALITFSSLLRYVNNMTVSTPGWMDGRPVAWAKHAYWTPNEFVECNPFEYLENRLKALHQGARDRSRRFHKKIRGDEPRAVIRGEADYCIVRGDGAVLDLPDDSIDAVVTDPPFGSNVQYGELTTLWTIWLRDLNPFDAADFMGDEVLVTRRTKMRPKTIDQYRTGLARVFAECYRVLKQNGILAFTFNNRDPGAWHAVMRAAIDAGFSLDPRDIAYQREIHAYRDTAHLRFKGELQGDALYVFRKRGTNGHHERVDVKVWEAAAHEQLRDAADEHRLLEAKIALHVDALRIAARAIQAGWDADAREQIEASRRVVGGRS